MGSQPEKWAKASLRVFSDAVSIEDISALLGVAASHSYRKGQPVSSRNEKVLRHESVWLLDSPLADSKDLTSHLEWLLDFIEPRLHVIRSLQTACHVDLFCLFASETGQGSVTLNSSLIGRLAKSGLDLLIDLFPPGPLRMRLHR